MALAGMRLLIESYVSRSDKGGLVFRGDPDGHNTYAGAENLPVVEDVREGGMAIMPMIGTPPPTP